MIIANPIYDTVFKFLLEDKEIAKRLLSAIIGEEIQELENRPQESTIQSKTHFLTVFRLDFKALIKLEGGGNKKVLIELQKSKNAFDILRFRRYLGVNYSETDNVEGKELALPIIPIYILGFSLSIKRPLLKIGRVYSDISTGEALTGKDDFVEKLSHDCFIIQIPLLPEKTQNRVERLLSVFNQKWILDNNSHWLMQYPTEEKEIEALDPDLQLILQRLHIAAGSKEFAADVQAERELDSFIAEKLREGELALLEKDLQLRAAQEEKQKAEKEKQKAEEEKEKAEKEKQKAEEGAEEAKRLAELERQAREAAEQEIEKLRKLLDK